MEPKTYVEEQNIPYHMQTNAFIRLEGKLLIFFIGFAAEQV